MKYRIYLVLSEKSQMAYIGKGPDGRIEGKHNKAFHRLMRKLDMMQWESEPFSTPHDALIAEASAIGIAERLGKKIELVNIQISYRRRFAPRYPFPFVKGQVTQSDLPRAIIVTLSPDTLQDGSRRVAPNSAWKPAKLAERARKYWKFSRDRVNSWSKGIGAPKFLVAAAKGSGIILGVFKIDNERWFNDRVNKEGIVAVPLKDKSKANANGMQGKEYTGNRRGGSVSYGFKVA
jgi:hypothetical protein